ncbi:uncharacterized protein JCM6883_000772 [Sporobolomyces salmoneus]|uniref:uncharacterized protein n=1 Tax=Sporobolomyces salmoneus TaxID=183962 RepID=UPI00317E71C5
MLTLRPLHNLYQTISPASFLENDHPLIAISQLERRGRTSTGEIEWVVGVGAKGDTLEEEIWWTGRLSGEQLEGLIAQQLNKTAISKETVIDQMRTSWIEGRLDVRGLEKSLTGKEPQPVELVMYFLDNIPFSISLDPCETSPLSLLSIMAHLIPPYLSSSTTQSTLQTLQPQLVSAQQERDEFSSDNKLLREELKELKRKMREGGGGGIAGSGKRTRMEDDSSQLSQSVGASQSQGPSQQGGTSVPLSPQKKGRPGIDFKAVMRPGTKGYAGSTNRVGRNLDDQWEEPESDSD